MSHRHWCEFSGHYWDCDGTATRLFATEPTVCMCLDHGVPMEAGDHTACSVELLSCPEHRPDEMRAMGYDPSYTIEPSTESERSSMFTDAEGNPTIGFCLWCGKDFYSMDEERRHTDNDKAACVEFQRCKDAVRSSTPEGKICIPPTLQALFDEEDVAEGEDGEATGKEK